MTGWAKSHCCEAFRETLPAQRIRESVAEAKQIAGEPRFKPRPEIRAACVCSCVQLFVIDYRTIAAIIETYGHWIAANRMFWPP